MNTKLNKVSQSVSEATDQVNQFRVIEGVAYCTISEAAKLLGVNRTTMDMYSVSQLEVANKLPKYAVGACLVKHLSANNLLQAAIYYSSKTFTSGVKIHQNKYPLASKFLSDTAQLGMEMYLYTMAGVEFSNKSYIDKVNDLKLAQKDMETQLVLAEGKLRLAQIDDSHVDLVEGRKIKVAKLKKDLLLVQGKQIVKVRVDAEASTIRLPSATPSKLLAQHGAKLSAHQFYVVLQDMGWASKASSYARTRANGTSYLYNPKKWVINSDCSPYGYSNHSKQPLFFISEFEELLEWINDHLDGLSTTAKALLLIK